MYAVIELKGTQIIVEKNQIIDVNRIKEQKSKVIKADKVLFGKKGTSHFIGDPYIKGAYAECEIVGDKRGKKIIVFKYRERKSSQSKKGHRQDLTQLKVKDIYFPETEPEKKDKEKVVEKKIAAAKKKPAPEKKKEKTKK